MKSILCGALVLTSGILMAEEMNSDKVEAVSAISLEGTQWQLVEINGEPIDLQAGDQPARVPGILFDAEKSTLGGLAGVNRFSGTYELDGQKLKFGPLMLTRMMGPEHLMAIEGQHTGMLGRVSSWKIEAKQLVLSDDSAAELLVYQAEMPAVKGTVSYRERIALPAGAVLKVVLEDVFIADKAATVISQIEQAAGAPPMAFELNYDASKIDPAMRYNVRARIELDGNLLFISDTAAPVLTHENGSTVNLLLKQLAR